MNSLPPPLTSLWTPASFAPFAFPSPLIPGRLVVRYKRFMADILLESGEEITAHCPNTGAMRGLVTPGTRVYVSYMPSPSRKYPYTWESAELEGVHVGVNTGLPNRLVEFYLKSKAFQQFAAYGTIRREVKYHDNSRIDFLLTQPGLGDFYLEVKNVHWTDGQCAVFPDSPTLRGVKHLHALGDQVSKGHRSAIIYIVQRPDVDSLRFALEIDPAYARAATQALTQGVEMWAYACTLDSSNIRLIKPLTLV